MQMGKFTQAVAESHHPLAEMVTECQGSEERVPKKAGSF